MPENFKRQVLSVEQQKQDSFDKVALFRKISQEQADLYAKKNAAYGDSFGDTFKKLGPISAITRITDKYNRLTNMVLHPEVDNLGESIEDTLRDLSNYCLMTLIEFKTNSTR